MIRFLACIAITFWYTVAYAFQPSLIPLPQSVQWNSGQFPLSACKTIVVRSPALQKEALRLQQMLGARFMITSKPSTQPYIELALGKSTPDEAYKLSVTPKSVQITASSPHGIFNGIQTLSQLIQNNAIPAVTIADQPSYTWRGYMVDAGRNFHSLPQLKQQIDIMSRYKMNVFHFHLTEDVAWRLQIKQYPQLTSEKSMTRNKGQFYSVEDMKELIRYCKDRYITLVPEIDMPGHSAAFKRAMGTDMQSAEGLAIVKNILTEICTTYDLPYIHIGADEVAIKNEQFLPEVTRLLKQYKKQVIGWAPGGNYDNDVIRELWKDEAAHEIGKPGVRYIDSRYLYLSDMEPLSTVVSLFQRKWSGDGVLGAEICLWSDRRVANEKDLLIQTAVYPAMLAFAERSWKGGGIGQVSVILESPDFVDFEKRLLDHQSRYFSKLPFQYVKQTGLQWKLFGPFDNKGDLSASFWPADTTKFIKATGGTVWLWHTHSPAVKAWLPSLTDSTTYYATARFFSEKEGTIHAWIETKNQSRSGADATPPVNEWDYMQSKIWVNGAVVPAPAWKLPGRASGLLEEPMVDEGYYYRPPQAITVKKGWNEVLIKLPYGKWEHTDWQVPPKFMFTFIPVRKQGDHYQFDDSLRWSF